MVCFEGPKTDCFTIIANNGNEWESRESYSNTELRVKVRCELQQQLLSERWVRRELREQTAMSERQAQITGTESQGWVRRELQEQRIKGESGVSYSNRE